MNVRFWAWQTLLRVERQEAYVNLALQQTLKENALAGADRRLLTELVYGTVQRRRTIDWLLSPYLRRPMEELDPEVRTVLRMTVYQLAFLDRIPAYAAVGEGVHLCKRAKPKAAGFVNAVLRAYLRDSRSAPERLAAHRFRDEVERLGVCYSYPDWVVEAFVNQFGAEKAECVLASGNQPAALSVRVNRLKADVCEVVADIRERYGSVVQPSQLFPFGLRLSRGLPIESWDLYQQGQVTVQDEGAMLVAPLLKAEPGQRVLDLCAAPGTKTTHIAEIMDDAGRIDACDLHPHKRQLIEQAAQRLGLKSIQTLTVDGRLLPHFEEHRGQYDAVLVDAPCSGLGVLRHRPDIRWRRTPKDIPDLSRVQRQLLTAAAQLVRPGGYIVYSTCTLLAAENEQVVQAVLADASLDLELEDVRADLPASIRPVDTRRGFLLTPDTFGTDGFYMVRLRRRAASG
ncbi:16S rRNA (cytosine(967)-C(5))-methyltransferase RsmB [Alicyclobacillus herbarius]|uniref:16S rRNA (cytosine(967)-C(5))-methyltransferase RsmB n=1 Tax=Alicyclobacillus herbarius TaxID=122960 RepID=UPI0004136288|nr:16S rRNA (cytosine(967)-C(5))-methyltransferase RsmB [Alicyclobacillus herbarius]